MQRSVLLTLALGATGAAFAQSLPTTGVSAITTYESAGIYWSSPGASSAGCNVRFRKTSDSSWSNGLNLWYDSSSNQCRGSLVGLTAGTDYEAQVGVGGTYTRAVLFTTWTNLRPVARTVSVPGGSGTYNITEGGTASGWVVYDGAGATRDAANGAQFNISVNASYVVIRNLNLRGAQQDAIRISPNVHDVVIEDMDISGWGRTRDGKWGADMDSAVRASCSSPTLERVTVQRVKMHDPRYSANSWTDGHPAGPQGITFSYCGGNHVFRWNEIYSTGGNRFNDGMGGEDNFSDTGFPHSDTDIYGNKITHTWDDAIEAEGGNRNVRIWGNYMDRTATGIATTVTAVGPVYIFRNVFNRNEFFSGRAPDSDDRQPFFKSGSSSDFGNGRRYLLHNTMLQATQSGSQYGLGGGAGVGGTGNSQLVRNTVSMNNIYHLWKPNSAVYQVGSDNAFSYDMFNGSMGTAVTGGINATPTYASGNGWTSEAGGRYQLAAGTPGFDGGTRIANFNDNFLGAAPDVGAAEAGAAAMAFGIAASTGNSGGGSTGGGGSTPLPPPPPPPTEPPPTGGTGTASPSLGLDSSSYTVAAGQAVTLITIVSGNSGTPTGSVNFRANGNSIGGCSASVLSSGRATCTTSFASGGAYAITGGYSGDAVYAVGSAGPITQTVTGSIAPPPATLPTSFGMDSNDYTSRVGQSVTFTASVPGDGGTVRFTDNNNTITGCSAVAVVAGYARCTTAALSKGSHQIRGVYSGNGGYSAGVAGPITQTVTQGSGKATVNVHGLWWGSASESGWGVNLAQQGDVVFATWFTYDDAGRGQWLVMPEGMTSGDNAWSGALYRTTGPAFDSATFDPAQVQAVAVGNATLTFSDGNNGVFTATVDGRPTTKSIRRQVFDAAVPTCTAGGTPTGATNYQDLWWRPNAAESGWGMNIAHQGDVMFVTWFTYDRDGRGMWLVASNVNKVANGRYMGTLYRTTGPKFDTAQWNPAAVGATPVGTVTLAFSDASNGTFTYTVNGATQSKPIARQVFSTPATVCN